MSATALVVTHTLIQRDPRVRREVEWLSAEGWVVDTVGLGSENLPEVRTHFPFAPQSQWTRPLPTKAALHLLLPPAARFRVLTASRLPRELSRALKDDSYDLVLVNDIALLPVIQDLPETSQSVHIDLHEYHAPDMNLSLRGARLANPVHRWSRAFIGDPRVKSRSTVASGIAEMYRNEFEIEQPVLIRNAPPFEQLTPSAVDDERIELVYHGAAAWERGLRIVIEAMELLPERFRLNLILVGSEQRLADVTKATAELGSRVRIFPPVTVPEIATRINEYDLEVMFYPPATANLRFALPNKLFEAVQARLGIVVGESPMMAQLAREHQNGLVIEGWSATDLANGLSALEAADVRRLKQGSDSAARTLNAAHEREVFLAVVAAFQHH